MDNWNDDDSDRDRWNNRQFATSSCFNPCIFKPEEKIIGRNGRKIRIVFKQYDDVAENIQ